jgi:hypothetical protein
MQVFASIRDRPTWIIGLPHTGWRGATPTEPGAKSMLFGFDITDDGAGNYLLVCFSADGVYGADSWYETFAEAFASATEQFGVRRAEWGPAQVP